MTINDNKFKKKNVVRLVGNSINNELTEGWRVDWRKAIFSSLNRQKVELTMWKILYKDKDKASIL